MRTNVFVQGSPIEYSLLHNVKPIGPSMGFYADREIPESVLDELGRRFVYARVAPRKWNGVFDVEALAAGEFIVPPGLIYRRVSAKTSWWQSLGRTGYVGEKGQTRPFRLR
jgi:hypothetical protein